MASGLTALARLVASAAVAVAVLTAAGRLFAAPLPEGEPLFRDTTREPTVPPPTGDPTILRARYVEVVHDRLQGGQAPVLHLNLFADVALTVRRERTEPTSSGQGVIWIGRVRGAPPAMDTATLVYEAGVLVGNLRADAAAYQVRYAGNGVHVVYEIDASAFAPD